MRKDGPSLVVKEIDKNVKEEIKVKYDCRISAQPQWPCPNKCFTLKFPVQGINDWLCQKGPSSPCTFNKNEDEGYNIIWRMLEAAWPLAFSPK